MSDAADSLKTARTGGLASVGLCAALLIFTSSLSLVDYDRAIEELVAVESVELDEISTFSPLQTSFDATHGEEARRSAEIVIGALRSIDVVANSRQWPIDPTGIFIDELDKDSSLSHWNRFFLSKPRDIGVFFPDQDALEEVVVENFWSAYRSTFGNAVGYDLDDAEVDVVSFSANRIDGQISDESALEAMEQNSEFRGLMVLRLVADERRQGDDFVSPWLEFRVPGRIEVLRNFSPLGHYTEALNNHARTAASEAIEETGSPFNASVAFWADIADLTPTLALEALVEKRAESEDSSKLEVWGLAIPSGLMAFAAPPLILISVLYPFVHIGHIYRRREGFSATIKTFGWIYLFPDPLSRVLTFLSLVILPTGSVGYLLVRLWDSVATEIAILAVGCIVGILMVGLMTFRKITKVVSHI
ncbi:MAG: hypothetical protein AAFR79_00790 [Pseudomonadota bacterium]